MRLRRWNGTLHAGGATKTRALSSVAEHIWWLADGSTSTAQIVDALVEEYAVDHRRASEDVAELLTDLSEDGFVSWGPSPTQIPSG